MRRGQCARIVRLLSRNTQLERYLRAAEQHGIVPITRLSPRYPARLRQTLGQRCPAVLFAKGDLALLSACCISVVGSRELTECGRAFAEAAGRLIARSDYTLCSGGAAGADRAAQAACLKNGGSAVIFPAGRLLDCPAPANVLYLADQGYDLPFSEQRALARNHFIHAMGEKNARCTVPCRNRRHMGRNDGEFTARLESCVCQQRRLRGRAGFDCTRRSPGADAVQPGRLTARAVAVLRLPCDIITDSFPGRSKAYMTRFWAAFARLHPASAFRCWKKNSLRMCICG